MLPIKAAIFNSLRTVNQPKTFMRNFIPRELAILSARDPKGIHKSRNNSSNAPLLQMTGESQAEVFTNSTRT